VRVRRALLPAGLRDDVTVELEGDTIVDVRPGRATDGAPAPGTLFPGFVNAHVHLELAPPPVPGGHGLPAWVRELRARPAALTDGLESARAARRLGTRAAFDVSNGGHTAAAMVAAGLVGIVQHELLGFGRAGLPAGLERAAAPDRATGGVVTRPGPHATYSTHPDLLVAAARPTSAPAAIHLAEDPAEREFLEHARGPFAELLDHFGVDWRWAFAEGAARCSPVGWLARLGVLGPHLLVVHGVDLDDADRALLAGSGATLVTCPRSNLHIGGRLPDLPRALAAGIRVAVGTDSLASVPDLDLAAEVDTLRAAFPEVPEERWWLAATAGGADATRLAGYGRIVAGASPGLWLRSPDGDGRWVS
jgi:cytosine/adenosine deaminase-related metal-dependent hydrolase